MPKGTLTLFLFFLFNRDNFFAVVIAAFGANAMGADHRATVRAGDQSGDLEFEMRTASFARATLWDCHLKLLSNEGII